MPSRTTKLVRNLFITVLSSADGTTTVGTLGTRTDVKHWVTVENLGGYPADLNCGGRISAPRPLVKFVPVSVGDTAIGWADSYLGLPPRRTRNFADVTLLPVAPAAAGTEIIFADVTASWPAPARTEFHTLDIQVGP